jgi:3-dehydroquinate synthase
LAGQIRYGICAAASGQERTRRFPMKRFQVISRLGRYEVCAGGGAWGGLRPLASAPYSAVFVLTERALWARWGKQFLRESRLRGARTIFIKPGEASKSLATAERVASRLLRQGADRHSLLVAFGGGVVGDLGGFVASTYMRGISLVQVPTTVVAQVDSAIGGKTGVNVGAMKNLVGTFYPPRLVVAEPLVLSSLDPRNFRSGLYEVVKHAILSGPGFFADLERDLESLAPSTASRFSSLLARAAQIKVKVVNRDEREASLRMVLNLGHTFGHALEEVTGYRRFLHGEAVAWGLLAAVELGRLLGLTRSRQAARMESLVRRVGPLPPIRDLSAPEVVRLVAQDKKAVGGRLHWVIPERIGKVRITTDVPPELSAQAFRALQRINAHD